MTGGARPRVRTVVVVVPVHDEAALLEGCLSSIGRAVGVAEQSGIRCVVRIVLDDCTDASAAIAARHPFPTTEIAAARVGETRAAGVEAALRAVPRQPLPQVWIANTDADSVVPPDWIIHQVRLADAGADVVLGTVRPDFADLSPAHREHWLRTHPPGAPAGNVHGANLGVRGDLYRAAGGFDPVAEHEDVALVARCRLLGASVCASDAAEVLTSGRFVGRTPGGYASFLRDLARCIDAGADDAIAI